MADDRSSQALDLGEFDGASGELERLGQLAERVSRVLAGAFRSAVSEGKSLRSLLGEIGRAFADIALKAALRPLGAMFSGAIETVLGGTAQGLGAVKPFAKGGVIAAPTYFPMGPGRLGLMGEAGAEAIMPLARTSDGRLGVGGPAGSVHVTFNVTASDARSFLASEAELSAMLLRAVRRGQRAS